MGKKVFNHIELKTFFKAILLSIFLCKNISAQENNMNYSQNLTITEGLAHNGITSIFQDSRGYMWIGSYDGLNRYNGFDFKVYKNTIEKDFLLNNRIRTIAEDKKGNLWIGSDDGVSLYNYSIEKFKTLFSNHLHNKNIITGPIVRKILFAPKSNLVVCATEGNGLLIFDENYSFLEKIKPDNNDSANPYLFYDGIELSPNVFLFSTSRGLLLFDLKFKKFHKVLEKEITSSNSLIKTSANEICLTREKGIAVVNIKKVNNRFSFRVSSKHLIDSEFVKLALDSQNMLWLGSKSNGVVRYDNYIEFIKTGKSKKSAFNLAPSIFRTSCIYATKSGVWVGTYNKGIYKFNLQKNTFNNVRSEKITKEGLINNDILNITPADSNHLFIVENHVSTSYLNTKTGVFEPIPFPFAGADRSKFFVFYQDSKKNLWVKKNDGIYRYKNGSNAGEKITQLNDKNFDALIPRAFAEDNKGNMWMALKSGIFKINIGSDGAIGDVESLNENQTISKAKNSIIRKIYADPLFDFIWIGTNSEGLFRINNETGKQVRDLKIDRFYHNKADSKSISSNFVSTILRIPNSDLWIGTERGGICKVNNSDTKPTFLSFTEKDGLSNNVVKNMLYSDGNLWISTNIGLNKFDLNSHYFTRFGKTDGLLFEDFNYAAANLPNGNLVFAGIDGLCYFDPKNLPEFEELPYLEFGDLKVFNKTINPGDEHDGHLILENRLNEAEELSLKYYESDFSVEVLALNLNPHNNHFIRYQLYPNNSEWIQIPANQRFINFNGLPPGNYVLKVMASNSLNKWTEIKKLKISISSPWYKTIPAYIIYFLIVCGLTYLGFYFLLRIEKLKHSFNIEQLEKKNIKEINDAKLEFFSNISHEIKTPLTLISGPIQILQDKFKNHADIAEQLNVVKRQSEKMSFLIEQVHDFQKADANMLKIHNRVFNFENFALELGNDFEMMSKSEKKSFAHGKRGNSKIIVAADKEKLERIFNNIITNAFKYTNEDDSIWFEYWQEGNNLVVNIRDTGKGIHQVDLPFVFDRFYQSKKKDSAYYGGAGIGLAFVRQLVELHYGQISVESIVGEGTVFTVKLPIMQKPEVEFSDDIEQIVLNVESKLSEKENSLQDFSFADFEIANNLKDSTIFIVEDNHELRGFISSVLATNFKIKTFTNGQECLDALEKEWPDLILSDVLMPVLNGLELCRAIKSDLKTSHIPVILLTACNTMEDQISGLSHGADAYVFKPFNIPHLYSSITAILTTRIKLRERFQIELPLQFKNNQSNIDQVFLTKLYDLMSENLDNQDLELDKFAKNLYMNRTHFYQKVKSLTNCSPFELLKIYRLKKAAEFLASSKYTVNEAYMMTGFKSRTHFSKLFKEKYKLTPGKYAEDIIKRYS